ncbi:MAG: TIGR00730 family Rossman fold protein [Polyangiaceae bacterium]
MRHICVFAGSNEGSRVEYRAAARALACALVKRNYGIVYGGGRLGLMGELADTVLALGGTVIGVIPERLAAKELAHGGVTRLEVVDSMHERKQRMATLSDAFIALPGGIGTFEEVLEAATWTQLRIHDKPVALYNALGYYELLLSFLEHAAKEQFVRIPPEGLLLTDDDPEQLLDRIEAFRTASEMLEGVTETPDLSPRGGAAKNV